MNRMSESSEVGGASSTAAFGVTSHETTPHETVRQETGHREMSPQSMPVGETVPWGTTQQEMQWYRFSRATMLGAALQLWAFVLIIAFAIGQQSIENDGFSDLIELIAGLGWVWLWRIVGIVAGLGIVAVLGGALRWRFMGFALVDDGIHFRSGILIKKHRHMRWDRVQSVEIEQKFLARLLKLGTVSVDSAGGAAEKIKLGLLSLAECESLRLTILEAQGNARSGRPVLVSRWRETGPTTVGSAGIEAPVYELETKRLLVTMVLSPTFFTGLLSLAVSIWFLFFFESGIAAIPLLFIALGAVWNAIQAVSKRWGTEVFLAANGVRTRSGLFSTFAETIPPGRVHAVEIYQPVLWRRFDWWTLRVTAAGKNLTDSDGKIQDSIIIPAGTREEVLRMLWVLVPNLGVEDEHGFLEETLEGRGGSARFTPAPRSSRWLDPFGWKRNAISLTRTAAIMRWGGFWRRSMRLVLHDHYQSLSITQGPLERKLGVASLRLRTVAGAIDTTQTHLDLRDVQRLLWAESEAGKVRRAQAEQESLQTWRARVGAG